FKAEQGSFVVNKIELDVTATADFLPVFLRFGIIEIFASINNRNICTDKTITDFSHEIIPFFESHSVFGPTIVEEESANTTRFMSVTVPEIIVALLFEFRIEFSVVLITSGFTNLMKMSCILVKQIIRR